MLFCGSFLLVMLHVGVCCAVVSVPCSLVVVCWERGVVFVVFVTLPNVSWSTSGKTGLSPLVKYFSDRSKAALPC